jgi:hypothetical protein
MRLKVGNQAQKRVADTLLKPFTVSFKPISIVVCREIFQEFKGLARKVALAMHVGCVSLMLEIFLFQNRVFGPSARKTCWRLMVVSGVEQRTKHSKSPCR